MKKNNFKSLMQAAVLVCTPLVIASCDDVFGDVDNPISSQLTVSQAAVNLELHADRSDAKFFTRKAFAATGAEIVYSSSNPEIAKVDPATGKIEAVNGGSCWIRAHATGKDGNGKMTYQEATDSFEVKVKDWRAQIKFAEESAEVNSALIRLGDFKLGSSEVYPATGCTVTYTHAAVPGSTATDPITPGAIPATGVITLAADKGEAVITATITDVPDGYEMKSFGDGTKVEAKFTLKVKEGVAYIAGYDAEGKEIRKTMLNGEGADEYTKLSDKLKPAGTYATTDVTLDAGWYVVDQNLGGFSNNIRVNGDVNFILNGNSFNIGAGKVMDETAAQGYKLNFFVQKTAAATAATGSATFGGIKDFKEVNICGAYINADVTAVENVTINKGRVNGLTGIGTGTVSIIDGMAAFGGAATDIVQKFATLNLAKVVKTVAAPAYAPEVGAVKSVGTVNLSEGTRAGALSGITNLTINKATSVGYIGGAAAAAKVTNLTINELPAAVTVDLENIGTATVTKTKVGILKDITDLTLNDVTVNGTATLDHIGTVTINKIANAGSLTKIYANALNIIDGTLASVIKVEGFKAKTGGYDPQAATVTISGGALTVDNSGSTTENYAILGDVAMTGGALRVTGPSGTDTYAIRGNVNVDGGLATGKFLANDGSHAVSGTLTGTFEGSSDSTNGTNGTWAAVTGSNKPMWLRNKK